jgi:hypothetical protein
MAEAVGVARGQRLRDYLLADGPLLESYREWLFGAPGQDAWADLLLKLELMLADDAIEGVFSEHEPRSGVTKVVVFTPRRMLLATGTLSAAPAAATTVRVVSRSRLISLELLTARESATRAMLRGIILSLRYDGEGDAIVVPMERPTGQSDAFLTNLMPGLMNDLH